MEVTAIALETLPYTILRREIRCKTAGGPHETISPLGLHCTGGGEQEGFSAVILSNLDEKQRKGFASCHGGKNVWEVRSSVVFLCFWVWGTVFQESGNLSVLAKFYPWDGGWSWKELLLEKKWHKVLKDRQGAGISVVCVSQRLQKIQAVPWSFGFILTCRQCSIVDFWSIKRLISGSSPIYWSSFSSGKVTIDIGKSIFISHMNWKWRGDLCELLSCPWNVLLEQNPSGFIWYWVVEYWCGSSRAGEKTYGIWKCAEPCSGLHMKNGD